MIKADGKEVEVNNFDNEVLRLEIMRNKHERDSILDSESRQFDSQPLNLKLAAQLIKQIQSYEGKLELMNMQLQAMEQRLVNSLNQQMLLQAAVEYSTDGISISDMRQPDNPIIYASPKLAEISGYSAQELEGQNWRMLYEDEPDEEARALLQEAIRQGNECCTYVRNLKKDGTPFFCAVTLYPLTDEDGSVTHYVNVIRDITEKKKADHAILQAQRLDSIGVLAGGIAHDFNNILHGVLVQSTLALNQLESEHPARTNVTKVIRATECAGDLTRQLLSYAGRGESQATRIDLNDLIKETHIMASSTISSKVIIKDDLASAPLIIEADSGQIQQVLLNLIMNASDAINAKGRIIIRSKRFKLSPSLHTNSVIQNGKASGQLDHKHVYALVEVEDNGCGMDDETMKKIFDPFFSTKEDGHGLGLAVTLGVIRTQYGMIHVESQLNIGTKISVFLPLVEDPLVNEVVQPIQKAEDVISGEPTIMIIDDDANVRETLDSALKFLGCQVISAHNGAEGIELYLLHQREIDLVLIDFHMPGMDGEETFKNLKCINSQIKCIFSSGFDLDSTWDAFVQTDNDRIGYLQKPYDLHALKNTICNVLFNINR